MVLHIYTQFKKAVVLSAIIIIVEVECHMIRNNRTILNTDEIT